MHCAHNEKPQLVAPSPLPLISSEHQLPARALSGVQVSASRPKMPTMTLRRIGHSWQSAGADSAPGSNHLVGMTRSAG
jgi:hypothetical protein